MMTCYGRIFRIVHIGRRNCAKGDDLLAVLREVCCRIIPNAALESVDDSLVCMDMPARLLLDTSIARSKTLPISVGIRKEMTDNDEMRLLAALSDGSHTQVVDS